MNPDTIAGLFIITAAATIAFIGTVNRVRAWEHAAQETRRRDDQAAYLTAIASDTDAPIHDRLAAEWLAAELDDPRAVERWLSA